MSQVGISKHDLRAPGRNTLHISGSFVPNGSSAISAVYGTGLFGGGYTVARTGTGVYRVALTVPFTKVLSLGVWKTTDETNFHVLRVTGVTLPTGTADGYFDVTHLASTDPSATNYAAADITASGLLRRINFMLDVALGDFPGNFV